MKRAFERLEPRAVKVACAVLRGLGGSNAPGLPDQPTGPIGPRSIGTVAYVVGLEAE